MPPPHFGKSGYALDWRWMDMYVWINIQNMMKRYRPNTNEISYCRYLCNQELSLIPHESILSNQWEAANQNKARKHLNMHACNLTLPSPLKKDERNMIIILFWFKGVLHALPKISMFCALSQNYRHLFEKWYMHLIVNCPRNSKMA